MVVKYITSSNLKTESETRTDPAFTGVLIPETDEQKLQDGRDHDKPENVYLKNQYLAT